MTIEGGTKSTEEVTGRILEFLARELSYNGMDGEVVDLIGDIPGMPGEDYTDGQCLWLINSVVAHWAKLTYGLDEED